MSPRSRLSYFTSLTNLSPRAVAYLQGSSAYPGIRGEVRFYPVPDKSLFCTLAGPLGSLFLLLNISAEITKIP